MSRAEPDAEDGGEPEPEGSGPQGRSSGADQGSALPEPPDNDWSRNNWSRRSILLDFWQKQNAGFATQPEETSKQSTSSNFFYFL
jgi:hypothetical protein